MARYKYIDTNPRFLPVDLAKQLLPAHSSNHGKAKGLTAYGIVTIDSTLACPAS